MNNQYLPKIEDGSAAASNMNMNDIDITPIRYESLCGDSIFDACETICNLAKKENYIVDMKFNDINICAYPHTTPASLVEFYYEESERRREEYINSPEYIEQEAIEEAKLSKQQEDRD